MKLAPFASTLAAGTLAAGPAFALGMLVAPAGNDARIQLSRTLMVRYPDKVKLIAQIKMTTNAPKVGWLIPVFNVENPVDNGVRVTPFDKASLDALEAISAPKVLGVCPDGPTGEEHEVFFGESWRAGQAMVNARLISAGEEQTQGVLTSYLQGREYDLNANVTAALSEMIDQNFMFVTVNIDAPASAGDPIVAIEYPLGGASDPRLGLFPSLVSLGGARADMLFFTLNTAQMVGNLPTNPWDLAGVQFVSSTETTYTSSLEQFLDGQRQTQALVLEYGAAAGELAEPGLATLLTESGATHLSRIRASFQPVALQTNVKTLTLRKAANAEDSPREREIAGRDCLPERDMGAVGGMGGGGAGGAGGAGGSGGGAGGNLEPDRDVGIGGIATDAGTGAGGTPTDGGGGGGGGGCQSALAGRGLPGAFSAFALLFVSILGLRRRRL